MHEELCMRYYKGILERAYAGAGDFVAGLFRKHDCFPWMTQWQDKINQA